jgi:hypothetical protein
MIAVGVTALNEISDPLQQVTVAGRVEFGMGGATFTALMDFYDGLVFAVPASKVRVDAAYPPAFEQAGVFKVNVNVGLAYGFFTQHSSPTRFTQEVGPIDPGFGFQVQIPPFATSFTVLSAPASVVWPPSPAWNDPQPPIDILVSQTATPGPFERRALYRLVDNTNLSLHLENQFPLFNGARFVTLFNAGNEQTLNEIVYNLAL